ncbi:MAG: hypothetical protein A2V66_10115 [Ignavibacteria bacterium RBG_13_36_8]|nr:MAG: hypothetical protein A2V66_10115 [Ignavibacteria bacterium RBG_13_36_8]
MKKIAVVILPLLIYVSPCLCQERSTINKIEKKFQAFEYDSVIVLANTILSTDQNLLQEKAIDILIMKAVSQYSLSRNSEARKSFVEVLKLNGNFELNPATISPKIIDFFNSIKQEFGDITKPKTEGTKIDSTRFANPPPITIAPTLLKNTIMRSMVLPGWGHLYLDQKTKGWILTSAGMAVAVSMVYFIFDANSKEKDYLNEVAPALIQQKYDSYNTSYKIRNALIISYVAIWLYSQIDILFFSDDEFFQNNITDFTAFRSDLLSSQFNLTFRINF